MVLSVEKETPAKKAGLLIGDIIVRFDSEPVTNMHELRRQLLKQDVVGKSVNLAIMRGEKRWRSQLLLQRHLDAINNNMSLRRLCKNIEYDTS